MKKKTYLVLCLTGFPLFIIGVALLLLPDQIITSYRENRELLANGVWVVTGTELTMASKYILLRTVPWIFFCGGEYLFSKQKEERDHSALLSLAIAGLITFNLMTIYDILLAFCNPSPDQIRLLRNSNYDGVFAGIGLLITGNSIPKFSFYGDGGPHSSYARENEVVFRKSKLIHSICLIITGIVLIVCNLFVLAPNQGTYFSLLCIGIGCGSAWLATRNASNRGC